MAEQYNIDYTFQNLVDIVKNYIKTNCINITNFASINATLKSGYSNTVTIGTGYTTSAVNQYYTVYSIVANAVSQATAANVDADMTNYLNTIGRTSLNVKIPREEVLQFLEELAVFCYNHCWFVNGQYATGNVFIYASGNRTDVPALPKTYFDKINAAGAVQLIENFVNNIKVNSRYLSAKYRYTWKWGAVSETAGSTSSVWYIL